MKVLIVDDQQYNRELLTFMLEDNDYAYCEAENGLEAIKKFQEDEDIGLILMDLNMPEMDGYEATVEIKRIAGDRHIPIFFVTALDDDETLSRCLEMGGDDFIPKPVNESVLVAKLQAHQRTVQLHSEIQESNQRLQYHQQMMDREHKIVETVFRNGMQRIEMDCDNINFHISPMSMFNGDLCLIARSPLGGVYVLLGDFTGHGLSAAIGCLPVSDIFYAMAKKRSGIGAIAREINFKLMGILPSNMFFCATILELDSQGDRLSVWSGGMNDMILVDGDGNIKKRIEAQHMPLGILDENEFEDLTEIVPNVQGLRAYVYTDGIIEAKNAAGEMFGEEAFAKLLTTTRGPCVDAIAAEVEKYHEGTEQSDDLSLLEVLCQPVTFAGQSASENHDEKDYRSLPWDIRVRLKPEELRKSNAIEQIVRLISSIQEVGSHKDIIFTVISELYSNSLEHGLLNLDSAIKMHDGGFERYYALRQEKLDVLEEGEITVRISLQQGETDALILEFTDSGDGFDFEKVQTKKQEPQEDNNTAFSRGVNLLESLCSRIEYSNQGKTVTAHYPL